MYEASFGLKRRPFAATPDATCFLTASPVQAALDELIVCVEHGQGIAVLTAPAGTGKTLLCERLRSELDERFETVFLRHASFLTRRALLQTVLCELNHPYHHPSEQELRLELFPTIRALQPRREALVLICDEAHQLTDSLIEELRILADFAEAGRPLVRLVLVGQLSLEEKLAQPSLEAFNQRIRAHVNLETFDRAGSKDYIDYRITWAGGRTDEVFTPEALELIAQVSDGVPRCINQLADHTLLLGFVAEQRPAGEELVREALHDLRQLPLHWNELATSRTEEGRTSFQNGQGYELETGSEIATSATSGTPPVELHRGRNLGLTFGFDVDARDLDAFVPTSHEPQTVSFEVGSSDSSNDSRSSFETSPATEQISLEVGGDDWKQTMGLFSRHHESTASLPEPIGLQSTELPRSRDVSSNEMAQSQFHDVVRESFFSSDRKRQTETNSAQAAEITLQNPNMVSGSGNSLIENWSSYPAMVSSETISLAPSVNLFHEEVIIDRYTAIDAGLKPVETSEQDTTPTQQVHSVFNGYPPFSGYPTIEPRSTASPRVDDFSELDTSLESVLRSRLAEDSKQSDPLERVLDSVNNLIDVVHEKRDAAETESPKFSTIEFGVPDHSGPPAPHSQHDVEPESVYRLASSTAQPTWEAVETEPVEAAPKSRPFRYLFSTLRRKQQELT